MDLERADRDRISDLEDARLKGELEGKLKGKLEEKLDVAAKMRAKNIPESVILEVTGLTLEQLKKLN